MLKLSEVTHLLELLSTELEYWGGKQRYHVCLLGEMATAFDFGARKSIKQVDARLSYETEIIFLANKIARINGYKEGWLVANHFYFDPPNFRETLIELPNVTGFRLSRPNLELVYFLKAYFYERGPDRATREEMIELGRILKFKSSDDAIDYLRFFPAFVVGPQLKRMFIDLFDRDGA